MTPILDSALALVSRGFFVFPLVPNSKIPAIKEFPRLASTDPNQVLRWWAENPEYNIGISTSTFGVSEALLAVDIDNKGAKKGDEEILKLELEGANFPDTFQQTTPTGGRHLVYRVTEPLKQGVNILGPGLDTRARGGYIVGAGSRIGGRTYTASDRRLALAPEWLTARLRRSPERKIAEAKRIEGVDPLRANARAEDYLENQAPLAVEGQGGDQTTFVVACKVKDFGVNQESCFELLAGHWNDRCSPPWSPDELFAKVANAYRYGESPVGVASPEADFKKIEEPPPVLSPIAKLNEEYAYIGGNKGIVIQETTDPEGNFTRHFIDVATFHQNLCSQTMTFGDGPVPTTRVWLKHPDRRSYDDLCFEPGKNPPKRFYNLWKGYTVEPLDRPPTDEEQSSLDEFIEHARLNICGNDPKLFNWLIGYFAHLIQKPWELPLVALVFRGKKGVGKNALVERVGYLLGSHFTVVSNRRYLTGNFNSFIENKVMLTLDEAFWSGDKAAEGVLKDLITGTYHQIERKGQEPYRMRNRLRVIILGNEDWLVPATEDERRFAVFNVGNGRFQDRKFFREMREKMERGGYRLLLKYLQEFDISDLDVTEAPVTEGLHEQKIQAMGPFFQWWFDCLSEGRIVGSDFGNDWPAEIEKDRLRDALGRYTADRRISGRHPSIVAFGRQLKEVCPGADSDLRKQETRLYGIPALALAREEWDKRIGHRTKWSQE